MAATVSCFSTGDNMAITKTEKITSIDIVGEFKAVHVRVERTILEDSEVISEGVMRYVVNAGDDYANQPQEIQDICALVHTTDIITAYNEHINNS